MTGTVAGSLLHTSFVLLLADDLGYGDPGFSGGITRTPHLDAMAISPACITFRNFHSSSTVCSPSRAALLTGRTGIRDCVAVALGCSSQDAASNCSESGALPNDVFSIADAATLAGAESLFLGKWHLGNFFHKSTGSPAVSHPGTHGFDRWHATIGCAPTMTPNCRCAAEWVQEGLCDAGHYAPGSYFGGPPWCANYWGQQLPDNRAPPPTNLTTLVGDDAAPVTILQRNFPE